MLKSAAVVEEFLFLRCPKGDSGSLVTKGKVDGLAPGCRLHRADVLLLNGDVCLFPQEHTPEWPPPCSALHQQRPPRIRLLLLHRCPGKVCYSCPAISLVHPCLSPHSWSPAPPYSHILHKSAKNAPLRNDAFRPQARLSLPMHVHIPPYLLRIRPCEALWYAWKALANSFPPRPPHPRPQARGPPAYMALGACQWTLSKSPTRYGHPLFFNSERVFQQAYIVPEQLRLKNVPENPALPPRRTTGSTQAQGRYATETKGTGSKRIYLDIQSSPENVAYPPRPVPGSVADLDIVMDHCDFSEKKVCSPCALSP